MQRRAYEHKHKLYDGYTKKYNIDKFVYYEPFSDIKQAIIRETQLKGWLRKKKDLLIEAMNPNWKDLSEEWVKP